MKIRRYIIPFMSILLTGIVITLAIIPLANTSWADTLRAIQPIELERTPVGNDTILTIFVRTIDAFLKVVLFMGVPAAITLGVLRLTRH